MSFIKHQKVPDGHKMLLFDVASLFTNVPLDNTIENFIKRIYDNNKINTPTTKKEIKELFCYVQRERILLLMVKLTFRPMAWQWLHH